MNRKILFLIIILIVIAAISLVYFLGLRGEEKVSQPVSEEEKKTEEPPALSPEQKAGEIGEVKVKDEETGEERPLVTPTLPPAIFSTAGKILEIKSDSIIVAGDGSSFADGVPRNLTCRFTDETLVFSKDRTQRYLGKEGLKYLKEGMKILVDSDENIRGKIEFKVKTIIIL